MACGAGKSVFSTSPWADQMKRTSQNDNNGVTKTSDELQSASENQRAKGTSSPVTGRPAGGRSPVPDIKLNESSVAMFQQKVSGRPDNKYVTGTGMNKSQSASSLGGKQQDIGFLGVNSMKNKFDSPTSSPKVSPFSGRKWYRPPGSPSPSLNRVGREEQSTSPRKTGFTPVTPERQADTEQLSKETTAYNVAPPPPKQINKKLPVDCPQSVTASSQKWNSAEPSLDWSHSCTRSEDADCSHSCTRSEDVLLPTRLNHTRRYSSDSSSGDDDEANMKIDSHNVVVKPVLPQTPQDDPQLLFERVPAPRPPKPQPRARAKAGLEATGTATNQDMNNNKRTLLLPITTETTQNLTSASSLDDGYSELCEGNTGAACNDGSLNSIKRCLRSHSPNANRRREGYIFKSDIESSNGQGVSLKRDSDQGSKECGVEDQLPEVFSPPGDDLRPAQPPAEPPRRKPACKPPPLPTEPPPFSPDQLTSFLFPRPASTRGSSNNVDYIEPSVLAGHSDIPSDSPPPIPDKLNTAVTPLSSQPGHSLPQLPSRKKKDAVSIPEELIQSVPPPVLPPRTRTLDDPSNNILLPPNQPTPSGYTLTKPTRSRLITLDVETPEQTKDSMQKIQAMDSIDQLGPPPPRPPLPPRGAEVLSPGRVETDEDSVRIGWSKGLAPDTVVPAPGSPAAEQSDNSSMPRKKTLHVDVPVPESPKQEIDPSVDDVPTAPPPSPPVSVNTLGRPGRIPSNRSQASYIDPSKDLASAPDVSDRKRPPAGHKFQMAVRLDSHPEPASPVSLEGQRPGAHQSYLDLLNDEDESREESIYYSFLDDEPLYQVYHRDVIAREIVHQSDIPENKAAHTAGENDDYMYMDAESVQTYVCNILSRESDSDYGLIGDVQRQSTLQDVIKLGTGTRKLWSEMPEVKDSGCLDQLTSEERKLQEALFEVITSEASYVKSLNLLYSHFFSNAVFDADSVQFSVISKQDHHVLFSNISKVREVSQRFLQKLEAIWHDGCIIDPERLANTMSSFAPKYFDVYVVYVKNQMYQERTLKHLRDTQTEFVEALLKLEIDPSAQGLTLQSFLVLPMQRVTRLPLLIDSICHRMNPRQPGYEALTRCLSVLQKIVRQCNEAARQMSNIEQVANISKMLEFKHVKYFPIVSQHRALVKQGQLTRVLHQSSGLFARKKETVHLFLFNDLLLITKKKGRDQYQVIEHTPRIHIHADLLNTDDIPKLLPQGAPSGCTHLIVMVLLEKESKFIMAAESMSERMRWVEAVTPPQHLSEDEKIYEDWDCPQVQCIQRYTAEQPDELSLEESDVINVSRKVSDGWYEGERIRDGEKGWFPSSVTVEIQSAHLRAKNLRQHYRLLLGMVKNDESQ